MGSCSSGGPNKYTGMCLVKSGEATKETEDLAKAVGHPALLSNSDYLKRSGFSEDRRSGFSARTRLACADNKSIMKSGAEDDRGLRAVVPSEAADKGSARSRQCGDSLPETRRATFPSTMTRPSDYDARKKDNSRVLPIFGHDHSLLLNTGAVPNNEHSSSMAVCSKSSTETDRRAAAVPSNGTATSEMDLRKQQRYHGRKASAPVQCYRWPGEYGTCIVPPPNKTVYDVSKSPCSRVDDVPESAWTMCWGDQKTLDFHEAHHKSRMEATSGSDIGGKTSPFGLLPSGGLSSASISSSYCHGSSTSSPSSSAESSLVRRRGSGGCGAKRSSSVSSCPSSTAELLPATARSDKDQCNMDKERRRVTAENRSLPATQRLWNLLRSPMEPLNGGNVMGSARKYVPLNSDASSQDGLTVTNTVSNKGSGLDRPT